MQPVVRSDTEGHYCVLNIFGDTAARTGAKLDADGPTAALFPNTDIHCQRAAVQFVV